MRTLKTAGAVREQAARLATQTAHQCDRDGDPEGAGRFRDLAREIRGIAIRLPAQPKDSK